MNSQTEFVTERFVKRYGWNELKSDWFFKLLIKFFKKEGLYNRIASLYFDDLKNEKSWDVLSEAYSTNYIVEKLFFGTLGCTITKWREDNVFPFGRTISYYEKKWSQFIYENKDLIPQCVFKTLSYQITVYGGFDSWFAALYRSHFIDNYQDGFFDRLLENAKCKW